MEEKSNSKKIKLAFAGHTNAGKTTLIRTLARSAFGIVSDSANSTLHSEPLTYDALHAEFIDCPGFQNAGILLMYLEGDDQFKAKYESKLKYELSAIDAIKEADLVLYVATLENVPDDSYRDEIKAIKSVKPNIIGILNKYGKQYRSSGYDSAENRVMQWKKMITEEGIDKIILFDAHWDSPKKVMEIYESITETLPGNKKGEFVKNYGDFKIVQNEIKREACDLLAQCIIKCDDIEMAVSSQDYKYDESKAKESLKRLIAIQTEKPIREFISDAEKLYYMAAQNPTISKEDFKLNTHESKRVSERFGNGAMGGTAGAATGAAIGALFGGIGAAPGALIGGFIGTLSGIFTNTNTTFTGKVSEEDMETIANRGVATLWALSHHGYGLGSKITEQEVVNLMKRLENIKKQYGISQLKTRNRKEIADWSESLMDKLESMPQTVI